MAKPPKSTEVEAPDDGRTEYVVTETAPSRVAGRRVKKGDKLRLTEDEALAELIALHLTPTTKSASEGASSDV